MSKPFAALGMSSGTLVVSLFETAQKHNEVRLEIKFI
jgi:hypothetical protein